MKRNMDENITYVDVKQKVIDACHAILGEDLLRDPEKVTLEDLQKLCKYLNVECTNELSTLILFDPENNLIPCLIWTILDKPLNKVFQLVPRRLFEYLMDNDKVMASEVDIKLYLEETNV